MLFPRNWIKQEMPRLVNAFKRVLNSWQPEQVIEDRFNSKDLRKVINKIITLDDRLAGRNFNKRLWHQIYVDTCKKCLLFVANLGNSGDKSEQEQQYQADKMMQVVHMCLR